MRPELNRLRRYHP